LRVLSEHPVTVAFGQTRRVGWDCTISVTGAMAVCGNRAKARRYAQRTNTH
jgi:predicted RNA-binding Zn ribbon-like protein